MSPALRPSRTRFTALRGRRYQLREWGAAGAPSLVLLHGWMDVSASFQFLVDAFARDWHVVAPDWRGFGGSDPDPDGYWFPDYLADLEALLDAEAGVQPATLVGHSMGGNIAMLYGGVRPARVRALVNLEGFGLRDTRPAEAPERYARWLDELRRGRTLRDYPDLDAVAARLRGNNARLTAERAAFLAPHWARPAAGGRYEVAADPAHLRVNPVLYREAEVAACWACIRCPVLWVQADGGDAAGEGARAQEIARRRAVLADCELAQIAGAGHMLHHDQPQALARCIEDFLARRAPAAAGAG